jgi:Sulfatase
MRANQWIASVSIVAIGVLWASEPVLGQEVTGTPGSPSATTTIEGGELPPRPQKFEGKIERNAAQSTPYWPMRVVPPKGAPNILLIMTDDTGFGVSSTFGGVIPSPTLDRVAANGLRYTNFNSTALCSPSRACIITAATITRWASAWSPNSRRASLATIVL